MAELATDNRGMYVTLAAGLAEDKDLLKALHGRLRSTVQKSPLMNGVNYCNDVEWMYRKLLRVDDVW